MGQESRLFEIPYSKTELVTACAHIPLFFVIGWVGEPQLAVAYGVTAAWYLAVSGFRHITGKSI